VVSRATVSLRRVHLRIHGLVQGVSFRACARDEALRLKVSGWIRNLHDGDVEALAEGSPSSVDTFLRWCRKGPEHARVDSVSLLEDEAATGEFASFEVVR
jgi:acylphosphatase